MKDLDTSTTVHFEFVALMPRLAYTNQLSLCLFLRIRVSVAIAIQAQTVGLAIEICSTLGLLVTLVTLVTSTLL